MAELKTQPHEGSVENFIDAIPDEQRREDARAIDALMASVTKCPGVMWGTSMVGYDAYDYRYASGREGRYFIVGWSPRKDRITLYLPAGFEAQVDLLAKLGPHTNGKSCLHLKRLSDVDLTALRKLVTASVKHMRSTNHIQ